MTPEQAAERDQYAQVHYSPGGVPGSWWVGWKDCIEHLHSLSPFVPEGYFHIGEEVDYKLPQDRVWYQGKMAVFDESRWSGLYAMPPKVEVRRRPAWEPKDGEAVFIRQRDHVGAPWEIAYGTFSDGKVYFGRHHMSAGLLCLKPFDGDYSKIGKPWSVL